MADSKKAAPAADIEVKSNDMVVTDNTDAPVEDAALEYEFEEVELADGTVVTTYLDVKA